MPVVSADIANQALQLIGNNQPILSGTPGNFAPANTPAAKAMNILYTPTYKAIARQFGWDFTRSTVALQLSGNAAPYPWSYEYKYPGIQVWSIFSSADDPNNPIPYNFNVGNALVSGVQQRVVWATLQNAMCRFNNAPNENTMDDDFIQAFVGLLSNAVAIALAGRPDMAMAMIQRGNAFEQIGESRSD